MCKPLCAHRCVDAGGCTGRFSTEPLSRMTTALRELHPRETVLSALLERQRDVDFEEGGNPRQMASAGACVALCVYANEHTESLQERTCDLSKGKGAGKEGVWHMALRRRKKGRGDEGSNGGWTEGTAAA